MTYLYWLVLVGLICSSLCLGSPNKACHPNDLVALKQFAGNLTNGTIIAAWSNESICCNWEGIVCGKGANRSDCGRVIMVDVSDKGLKGVISPAVGMLDELKLLDLSHNHLEGELPPGLSKLKQLEYLDLSHNMLTGPALGTLDAAFNA